MMRMDKHFVFGGVVRFEVIFFTLLNYLSLLNPNFSKKKQKKEKRKKKALTYTQLFSIT